MPHPSSPGIPLPNGNQYKDVRSLARGLHLLKALNRHPGATASIAELAQSCELHRTTVKRLLETLRQEGFVRRTDRDGQYCLTFEVRRLSEGFVDDAWITQAASPLMQTAVKELLWPCDLATVQAGFMVVRESTHRWSSLSQHRAMIGESMPLFVTALGRAYLSACPPEQRQALLSLLQPRPDKLGEIARNPQAVQALIDETRQRGYAVNNGEWMREAHFGAIAVPVFAGPKLLAALNIIYPKTAVTEAQLQQRYLPALRRLAERIGKAAQNWLPDTDDAAAPHSGNTPSV